MAADGTPELAARRCGAAIARLRTSRNWSRAKLIARFYDQIAPSHLTNDRIGESWLARLEQGRVVKISRHTVEALCRALDCTPRERAQVLLLADRNALGGADEAPSSVAETLTYALDLLYRNGGRAAPGRRAVRPGIAPDRRRGAGGRVGADEAPGHLTRRCRRLADRPSAGARVCP
jgi:transcriptional regulator with XRE-family HTH domain